MSPTRLAALVALALSGFAANSLLCRLALAAHAIDPVSFTAIRIGSGALVLAAIAGPTRARAQGDARGALALFGYAIAFSLAYVRLGAATGALLLFGAVQATMLGVAIARGERPGARTWLGLAFAIAGLALLVAPGLDAPDAIGAVLMVGAGIAWGAYSLMGRAATDPLGATAGNFARACLPALAAVPVALAWTLHASPLGIGLAVASGALASGVGYALWYAAMPTLGATRAAIVQLLVPVLAAALAVPLLGESIGWRTVVAGLAVIGGVAFAIAPRRASAVPVER